MKPVSFCLFFALLLLQFFACEAPKQPEFKELVNVKFNSWTKGNLALTADAVFNNPNPFGIQLTGTDMNLLLDGKKAAHVQQAVDMQVPAARDFKVPINISINPKDLSPDLLWGGALSMLGNKKINMRLNGTVTVRVLEIDFKIPVDHTQELSLKDLRR
ncbi:hypothetical protein C7N43_37030 [Sphingobacteriales bacterium UPWRP_1]|nr:hypothetical protein BVG80_17445 [Sphingobacteriales bacterium TSM_CSM]PSJ71890.1 hypothetical protein C7N43_37030 [Sphingobacteriales bacterium UPWRP_1]